MRITLGPERLAELLLELAHSDSTIKRRIRLAGARATSPRDPMAQGRPRLFASARLHGFLQHPPQPSLCLPESWETTCWTASPRRRRQTAALAERVFEAFWYNGYGMRRSRNLTQGDVCSVAAQRLHKQPRSFHQNKHIKACRLIYRQ
jgi:hypothetical protein